MFFTKPKFLITCLATACALSAAAVDDMYIVGPGVVTGYDYGIAPKMSKTSGNPDEFMAVMYLDNKDGLSFRMQSQNHNPDKEGYYAPSANGQKLSHNTTTTVGEKNDTYFSVEKPGVYLIKFEATAKKVTIQQMDYIYMVGDGCNAGWNGDTGLALQRNGDVYTAEIDFKSGSFKYCIDKPHCFDNRWMLFKDLRGAFKTSLDDTNWNVGMRDKTGDGNDVEPFKYRVSVNTATKEVKYTRLMQSVSLDGGAVLNSWDKNGAIPLTKEGDVFKAKHVYFTTGNVYKPVVDGYYYGYEKWTDFTTGDDTATYMRYAADGANFSVSSDGFRSVEVGPSSDGTLYIKVSAPQDVYLEGFCGYDLNANDNLYYNNNLTWVDSTKSFAMKVGGETVATLSTQGAGWYCSYISFNGYTPVYQLNKQVPSISGDAAGNLTFSDSEISGQSYVKRNVLFESGKSVFLHLGVHTIECPGVPRTGYYDITVNLNAQGIPQLTYQEATMYFEGYGNFVWNAARNRYENNSLAWLAGNTTYTAKVNGQKIGEAYTGNTGWYTGYISFNGRTATYQLERRIPQISVANNTGFLFDDSEIGNQCYVKKSFVLERGKAITLTLGDKTATHNGVDRTGFYEITVNLTNDGNPQMSLRLLDMYIDGFGSFTYDTNTNTYVNTNLKWLDGGKNYAVIVDGKNVTNVPADKSGWYNATATFDIAKGTATYLLTNQIPWIDGAAGYIGFDTNDISGQSYVKGRYLLHSGKAMTLHIGDKTASHSGVAKSGYYRITVNLTNDSNANPQLTVEPLDIYIENFGTFEYNPDAQLYYNNSLKWLTKGEKYNLVIGGQTVHTFTVAETGWHNAYLDFSGAEPSYSLSRSVPVISGDATGRITFDDYERADNKYIKERFHIEAGKDYQLTIAPYDVPCPRVEKSGFYTATVNLNPDNGLPRITLAGPVEVNMPLTPGDFDNGRKHYFLVGQRMGAWRLQPEWEFTPDEEGNLVIDDRLLYNGYVMVGVVDNYDDYIAQRYHAYTDTNRGARIVLDPTQGSGTYSYSLSDLWAGGANGCADGKFTSTRYNDIDRTAPDRQHGSYEQLALNAINIYSADGHGDQAHLQSPPSRTGKIRLSVDNAGNPSWLAFEQVTTDPMEVARLRTFALCGGGILNNDVDYIDGVQTSPLNHQQGYSGKGWADAWIQYDVKGKPYVDAHGEFIYQTSFTENWLRKHPSYFNFEGIEYTSNNITFFINEEVEHDPQFGQRTFKVEVSNTSGQDDGTRHEVLYTYFNDGARDWLGRNSAAANNLNDAIRPQSRMVCYEVSDMWMEGMFKIWSGWGGSATNYEYETNHTNYTRWYQDNAGHGAWREDCTAYYKANTEMAYTLFEDMDAANFGIGYGVPGTDKVNAAGVVADSWKEKPERHFFKKVRLWYNLDNGLVYRDLGNGQREASFLVFYQEQGAPRISIAKHGDTRIKYTFDSPLTEGMNHEADARTYGNITHYKVECVWIRPDGSDGGSWEVGQWNIDTPRHEFGGTDVIDPRIQAPGSYYYRITTKRANTGDQIYTSNSNIIRIDGDPNVTAIGNVTADRSDLIFSARLNPATRQLGLWSNVPMGRVAVYSVNGSLVKYADIDDTEGTMDLETLTPGVYIVNALNTSSRFVIR